MGYYIVVAGASVSACKSDARKEVVKFCEMLDTDDPDSFGRFIGVRSLSTRQGLLEIIQDGDKTPKATEGSRVLLHVDELKALFDGSRRDYARDLQSTLIDLWDCPPEIRNNVKHAPMVASYPCFNLFGCSTKAWLFDSVRSEDLDSGFMNRFLTFYTDGLPERVRRAKVDTQS